MSNRLLKKAFRAHLLSKTDVTDFIGQRLYYQTAPTGQGFPRLIYNRVANDHVQHQQSAAGISVALIQLDSWSDDSLEAADLAEACRQALDGLVQQALSSVFFHAIRLEDERDFDVPPVDNSETSLVRISQDYRITHRETVPTP